MDRSGRVFAGSTEISLGGQSLRVRPRVIADFAEIEQQMLSQRFHPQRVAHDNAHLFDEWPELREELKRIGDDEARNSRNYVTRDELYGWLSETVAGLCFNVWLSIRDSDRARYTLTEVTRLVLSDIEAARAGRGDEAARCHVSELRARIDQAAGNDEWARMDWPITDDHSKQQEYQPIPWRSIVRKLASEYGYTPNEVSQLTVYQLQVLLAGDTEAEGRRVIRPSELASLKQRRRAALGQ